MIWGLTSFEQSSWSTHRRHELWGMHEELHTKEHYDTFVRSFMDNYPGMCDGRSMWTIDCRKFDDPDNDRSMRTHIGRTPRIMKSISESENHHALAQSSVRRNALVLLEQKHRDHDMQEWTTPSVANAVENVDPLQPTPTLRFGN